MTTRRWRFTTTPSGIYPAECPNPLKLSTLPAILDHYQRDIVGLRRALGKPGDGAGNSLVQCVAGVRVVLRDRLPEPLPAEEFAFEVLRFGDSVGIDHDLIAVGERNFADRELGGFDKPDRRGGGGQQLDATRLPHDERRAMAGIHLDRKASCWGREMISGGGG